MTEKIKFLIEADKYDGLIEHKDEGDLPTYLPYPLWKYPDEWMKNYNGSKSAHWWEEGKAMSYKSCPSFVNTMKKTIVLPIPSDFVAKIVEGELSIKAASDLITLNPDNIHPNEQFGGLIPDNVFNLKFGLPYTMSVRRQTVALTDAHLHASNYEIQPWKCMTALLEIGNNFPCNINTLWNSDHLQCLDDHRILLGTPMAYLTFPEAKGKVDVEFVKVGNGYGNTFHRKIFEIKKRYLL